MDVESQYYIILSHTIPSAGYVLQGEHTLRPAKASREMFGGYENIITHHLPAVMTLKNNPAAVCIEGKSNPCNLLNSVLIESTPLIVNFSPVGLE